MSPQAAQEHFVKNPHGCAQTDHWSWREAHEGPERQAAVLRHEDDEENAYAEKQCDVDRRLAHNRRRASRLRAGPDLLDEFR